MTSLPLYSKIITMIDKRADQFAGTQCDGAVNIFWHETGPTPLHGWYWRYLRGTYMGLQLAATGASGPFTTSRGALLDAINAGHVHTS